MEAVGKRLDGHDALITGLIDHGAAPRVQKSIPGAGNAIEKWTDVVRKPTKIKKQTATTPPTVGTNAPRPVRPLPRAVVIKRGESSFAETVKNIRAQVNVDIISDSISKMRDTRNGNVLIEILGGSDKAETDRSELEKSLEPRESIRSFEQRSLLQLIDLDCVTTKEDMVEVLCKELGITTEDIKVLSVMPVFAGEQTAIVLIPRQAATKLLGRGRMRVGLAYSRVREAQKLTRCYKCQEEGHETRKCTGVDRTKDCRRCGKSGYFVIDCKANMQEAEAFRCTMKMSVEAIVGGNASST